MTKETPFAALPATSDQKAAVRGMVFEHLAGMVIVPTVKALWDRGVFQMLDKPEGSVTLDQIVEQTRGNRGYLKVALRLLASAGLLSIRHAAPSGTPEYLLTVDGITTVRLVPLLFSEVAAFTASAIFLEDFLFGKPLNVVHPSLQILASKARVRWDLPLDPSPEASRIQERIRAWLDGILVGPAMVALARGGVLASLLRGPMDLKSVTGNVPTLAVVFEVLAAQGWAEREHGRIRLTSAGRYAAEIASAYGVTVSYLPMFSVVSTLLFGNARIARVDDGGTELLCNRAMNVWGSGGAHKSYFRKVDDAIVEIFNRPIEEQPRGICDMGCGDGTLLDHLYGVVKTQTARGAVLDAHPLVIIGADFNKVARRVSAQRLRKAGIPNFRVIRGDINRPAQLAGDLEEIGLDIHDLLHVRSFLDHNRPYAAPANYTKFSRRARSSGAFAYLGEEISNDELEENLVRHLRRWAPYVGRFGLLLLELHTLAPETSAAHPAMTPVVAYDGTHGFSDQYLVEAPVFLDLAREAGLVSDERYRTQFPPSELATVTMNFFTAPQ